MDIDLILYKVLTCGKGYTEVFCDLYRKGPRCCDCFIHVSLNVFFLLYIYSRLEHSDAMI